MTNEASNYIRVTEEARKKESQLESIGYLHSNYERFKDISSYDRIYLTQVEKVADLIIKKQLQREQDIYRELGVKNVDELVNMFFNDQALNTFIESKYDNAKAMVAEALKESVGNSSLSQTVSKVKKKQIEDSIEDSFNKAIKEMTEDYQKNLNKITGQGLSKEVVSDLKKISNRENNNKMKNAMKIASGAFSQWRGDLHEQTIAMFLAKLNKVKGVEVTGSNLDSLSKFIKSDVTAFTDTMSIGFTAKNYKIIEDKNGNAKLKYKLNLHGGGKEGNSFESFMERLESLKNTDLNSYIADIVGGFRSNNFYYNLINEAVQTSSFKTSQPALDFINTVKSLAAAWFGTQLVAETKEGLAGQNVDFLIVGKRELIPISSLLIALREKTLDLTVSISSNAKIDEDSIYEQKIESPYTSEGLYSSHVQNIGFYAGQEVYSGIKISSIKLDLVLNQLK